MHWLMARGGRDVTRDSGWKGRIGEADGKAVVGWTRMGWDGTGQAGTGRYGTGWDGTGRDGTGLNGMG